MTFKTVLLKASCAVSCDTLCVPPGQPVSSSCPVQMSPPSVVVRFGDSFSVNCSSSSDQIESMGLETVYGSAKTTGLSYVNITIESARDWNIGVMCYINRVVDGQCLEMLPVTVYKTPDRVSISQPSLEGPLVEGNQYSIQCDIVNVAPVSNLSVHWHKGDTISSTERFDGSSISPVNVTSVFNLTGQRGDDGTQIWCEAQLDFWGQVPNLTTIKSESRDVIVLYSPTFMEPKNVTLELPARGKFTLDCAAAGKPTPVYSWQFPHSIQRTNRNENQSSLAPSIQLPGTYRCTASNSQGSKAKYFTVTEATRNRTTFAALVGGFVFLGVVIFIGGLFLVTPEGTFSLGKGSYL